MNTLSRRNFLKKSSAVAGLAVAPGVLAPGADLFAMPPQPHMKFPAAPRDRLAVASWPFREYIESPTNKWARNPKVPGMDLKDFAAMVVKRFNLYNIEPLGQHFASTEPAYLSQLREAVEKARSHIVNIPTGVRESFYDPDAATRKLAVEHARKWVDIARAVGSPSIRMHIEGVPNVKPNVDFTAECLGQLASYGGEKNILVNLENDDLVSEDAFFIVKIIEKVDNPYLRALPDFCNSMLSGNAQFNYDAVTAMFKHAYNIAHMKDSEVGEGRKIYTIDVGKSFGIAKASGFRGYYSMEWDSLGDPYNATQRLINESLKYLT